MVRLKQPSAVRWVEPCQVVLLFIGNGGEVVAQPKVQRQLRIDLPVIRNVRCPCLEVQVYGVAGLYVGYRAGLRGLRGDSSAEEHVGDLVVRDGSVEAEDPERIDRALTIQHHIAPRESESDGVLSASVGDAVREIPCRLEAAGWEVRRPAYAAEGLRRASRRGEAEASAKADHGIVGFAHLEGVGVGE